MKTLALSLVALFAVTGAALADGGPDNQNRDQLFAVQQVQGGVIEGRNSVRVTVPSMESEITNRQSAEAVRTGAIDLSGLRFESVNLRAPGADGAH
jgi:phosphoribulokinase